MIMDDNVANDIQDIRTATDDILTAVNNVDSNHVEVVDHLDKITDLLERMATSWESLEKVLQVAALESIGLDKQAQLLREGRVS
jgi:uncharacterized membrane-anchored protein YhcB (DUF1043 family)